MLKKINIFFNDRDSKKKKKRLRQTNITTTFIFVYNLLIKPKTTVQNFAWFKTFFYTFACYVYC